MGKYRIYSPDFKAESALESLRGQKSDAQICRERDVAPDLLSRWRQQLLERAPLLFVTNHSRSAEQAQIADLERLIRRMAVELDAAKKLSRVWRSPEVRNAKSSNV